MKVKPDLSFWKLWNISFGFFGVQIAYALQSANISRIFSTLGADPHSLSYFWILPPLAGIIVQPIVGAASDRTWTRFGRRIPYLFIGSLVAVLVMCLLPNAGSFGMAVSTAMIFGLVSLMFLDTSINMAMQPFKMMVGDMQCRQPGGLSVPVHICVGGYQQYGTPRGYSRFRNLLVLYRGRHSDILRYLYNGQSQGNAARRVCPISRYHGRAGT